MSEALGIFESGNGGLNEKTTQGRQRSLGSLGRQLSSKNRATRSGDRGRMGTGQADSMRPVQFVFGRVSLPRKASFTCTAARPEEHWQDAKEKLALSAAAGVLMRDTESSEFRLKLRAKEHSVVTYQDVTGGVIQRTSIENRHIK